MKCLLGRYIWPISRLLRQHADALRQQREHTTRGAVRDQLPHVRAPLQPRAHAPRVPAPEGAEGSGVAIWSKIGFVVDFRNLLFGCDFELSFSKDYSLMKIFNYEVDFTAKCDT